MGGALEAKPSLSWPALPLPQGWSAAIGHGLWSLLHSSLCTLTWLSCLGSNSRSGREKDRCITGSRNQKLNLQPAWPPGPCPVCPEAPSSPRGLPAMAEIVSCPPPEWLPCPPGSARGSLPPGTFTCAHAPHHSPRVALRQQTWTCFIALFPPCPRRGPRLAFPDGLVWWGPCSRRAADFTASSLAFYRVIFFPAYFALIFFLPAIICNFLMKGQSVTAQDSQVTDGSHMSSLGHTG